MDTSEIIREIRKIETSEDFTGFSDELALALFEVSELETLVAILSEISFLFCSVDLRDVVWEWVTKLARTIPISQREIYGTSIFENLVEGDEDYFWIEKLMRCIEGDLKWVVIQAYSGHPDRLYKDLEYFVNFSEARE